MAAAPILRCWENEESRSPNIKRGRFPDQSALEKAFHHNLHARKAETCMRSRVKFGKIEAHRYVTEKAVKSGWMRELMQGWYKHTSRVA